VGPFTGEDTPMELLGSLVLDRPLGESSQNKRSALSGMLIKKNKETVKKNHARFMVFTKNDVLHV
jgi:hypothetical protein